MTHNTLCSRFDKLTALAVTIPEFDEMELLTHVPNGSAFSATEVIRSLAGLLAEDTEALLAEAEEMRTNCRIDLIGESAAAAVALFDFADRVEEGDSRSHENMINMSYVTARTFVDIRDQLARETC